MAYHNKTSKYKKKLYLYFFLIVLLFSIIVAGFQYHQERSFKRDKLEYALNIYAQQVHKLIQRRGLSQGDDLTLVDSLHKLIPEEDIRISVIDKNGVVFYDSSVMDLEQLDNHLKRPEVQRSRYSNTGSNIRLSESTGRTYYYYSRFYYDYYVRTALPYDEDVIQFLRANNLFLYFLLGLFAVTLILLIYVTDHLGSTISKLRNFSIRAARNEQLDPDEKFGKTELGEIGQQISTIYHNLKNTSEALQVEREKLFKHLQISQEGIAIFNHQKKLILWNSHFIDYINFMSNIDHQNYSQIFQLTELEDLNKFIDSNIKKVGENFVPSMDIVSSKMILEKSQHVFLYQVVIFQDGSFEISVTDITKQESQRKIKQEMTLNIAHELKTPVTAISGFLETIKDNPDLPAKKAHQFIERSCNQINRLSSLIQDISLLSKIEEAGELFEIKPIPLYPFLKEIVSDFEIKLQDQNMKCNLDIVPSLVINANPDLLDTVFRNLIDNSVKYSGENTTITISNYFEDANYYYFSHANDGQSIPEQHLPRIFERFYRIDDGRSRQAGGTGLGLSIVKNAVSFHKGRIYVKNRSEGGVEFFFSIKKQEYIKEPVNI